MLEIGNFLNSQDLRGDYYVHEDKRIQMAKPAHFTFMRAMLSVSRRAGAVGAVVLICGTLTPGVAAPSADGDPVLKMDVPKMDKLPQRQTLKGGVFHHELLAPKPPKLQTGTSNNTASLKTQDSKLSSQKPKHGLLNMFKVKVAKEKAPIDALTAQVPPGTGIIGVKFVLGFGLPPTINRVFPGTPAHAAGLRADDIIIAVDGVPTSGLTKEEVYAMIVGLPDTPVTISVMRKGDFIAKTMSRMDFNDIPDPAVKQDYLMSI